MGAGEHAREKERAHTHAHVIKVEMPDGCNQLTPKQLLQRGRAGLCEAVHAGRRGRVGHCNRG